MEPDPARWRHTAQGWQLVPPGGCPRCRTPWRMAGPTRPAESSIACLCPGGLRHTTWACRRCGCVAAVGCVDTTAWSAGTVPVDLPTALRARIP